MQPTVEEEGRRPLRISGERGGGILANPLPELVSLEVVAQARLVEPDLPTPSEVQGDVRHRLGPMLGVEREANIDVLNATLTAIKVDSLG